VPSWPSGQNVHVECEDGPIVTQTPQTFDPEAQALRLAAPPSRRDRLTHLEIRPANDAKVVGWPEWVAPAVVDAALSRGVVALWSHQAEAATSAYEGKHTIVATGTASGKSLAYLLPTLTRIVETTAKPGSRGDTVVYLSPTKALAHDQLQATAALAVPGVRETT
jgi:DEAD/DEAH box helicase domain-containing protein